MLESAIAPGVPWTADKVSVSIGRPAERAAKETYQKVLSAAADKVRAGVETPDLLALSGAVSCKR